MTDIFTKAKRSDVMARIRSAGNKATELRLIAVFKAHGITGWRRGRTIRGRGPEAGTTEAGGQRTGRAGGRKSGTTAKRKTENGGRVFSVRPDFVFPALRLAVFVDGCFWHGCPLYATQPKTRAGFWREKIARNRARDALVTRTLRAEGWRVLRVWEHELRTGRTETLRRETGNLKGGGRRVAPARLLARLRRVGLCFADRDHAETRRARGGGGRRRSGGRNDGRRMTRVEGGVSEPTNLHSLTLAATLRQKFNTIRRLGWSQSVLIRV